MKSGTEGRILQLVVVTGISSVVSQLLIIREFLSRFQGNEFVIALILFSWLVIGGFGTWASGLAGSRILPPDRTRLSLLTMLLAVLSPLTLLAVRVLRDVLFVTGSAVGFYATFGYILATIAPYCLLLGFVLPYSLFCARVLEPGFSGTRIYIADNIGDMSGGALFSFLLVFFATPMQALVIVNAALLASAFFLVPPGRRFRLALGLAAAVGIAGLTAMLWTETPSLQRPVGELVHYKESRYGRVEIFKNQGQHTLFLDGRPVFSDQNLVQAEESVHYPLSQLDTVEHVLLVSAEGGMMRQIRKYEPASVDYVEIDPAITRALFQYDMLRKIPGLNVIHQDARLFLSGSDKQYDAILVNLPEPETFQINRFFTIRFFAEARRHLTDNGIFSFHTNDPGNYISEIQGEKISILHQTASAHFSDILMLPGQRLYFLCADRSLDTNIPAGLAEKNISTQFVRGYYTGNVTPDRIRQIKSRLQADAPVNTDYVPRLVGIMFSQWFAEFESTPAVFMGLLALGLAFYLLRSRSEEFVLFTTGAMTMGSEVLVIFAFQVFFGYIYFEIGLIVTVFLAGLLPGAVIGEYHRNIGRRLFILTDIVLIAAVAAFMAALWFAGDVLPESAFLLFGGIVSLACGIQFPVALHVGGRENPAAVRAFSADLIGAAVGTLAVSVVLMPYFGLIWTAAALIGMKTLSLTFVTVAYDT
ncbi:MAG: hypothetical protein KGY56_09540 [Desulfobacterales bacterium]|nr:hypothetical protein [Desulfobacterales bacterium]